MFRTAALRSVAQMAARPVARYAAVALRRRAAVAAAAVPRVQIASRAAAWTAVRCYASGGGLKKEEVEGRIMALLQGFDKVRFFFFFRNSGGGLVFVSLLPFALCLGGK